MPLAKRIIPTLLFKGDTLVKGKKFGWPRSIGSVVQAAKIYGRRGADEILLCDIAATPENRGPNLKVVEKIADDFFTPLTVGGGVRSWTDVRDLLKAGADKVAINTAAYGTDLIRECADKFGSQAIVASIDYRLFKGAHRWHATCYSHCGQVNAAWNPHAAAVLAVQHGAGEILLTCIDCEGTMLGYELDYLRLIAGIVTVPVIANGGCGGEEDCRLAFDNGASAVGIGSLFAFTDATPATMARHLADKGIEVRMP